MSDNPSREEFAAELLESIKQQGGGEFQYDAENFRLLAVNAEGVVNLTNLYDEHCTLSEEDRASHLERLAIVCGGVDNELPATFSESKGSLRPKIWNRSTFAMMDLKQKLQGGEPLDIPLYPLGSHMYSSVVFDTELAMRSIATEELESWGVSYYQALEAACENLNETTLSLAKIGDGLYSFVSGDNYDSSRVLLLDRIRELEVDGDHIAVVPQRDATFITGSTDEVSLSILLELIKKTLEDEPRPLCPLPMRLEEGEWVDWKPPRNHVLRKQFDELELRFLAGLYAEQKQLLDALADSSEEAAFIASFSAIQDEETEQLSSYAVWGRDLETLLPEAQHLVFIDDDGMQASGEWLHVTSVLGDLMRRDDSFYPPRYRVDEFPSAKQLSTIGKIEPFV